MAVLIDTTTLMVTCLFSALLTLSGSVGSNETVVYIRPTVSTDACYNSPCLTLNQFIQESDHYLGESTILYLMTGEHIINNSITIADISSFTMVAFNTEDGMEHAYPIVNCTSATAFSFQNIGVATISGIIFDSCGRANASLFLNGSHSIAGSVVFDSVQDGVNISECVFKKSCGSALIILSSNIDIHNCTFEANHGLDRGGGMLIWNSTAQVSGNTVFRGNTAVMHGGAVFALFSTLHFMDTNFIGNSAGLSDDTNELYGGAVCVLKGTLYFKATVLIGNSIGSLSSVVGYGGAVFSWSSEIHITDTDFLENTASSIGGAVAAYNCSVTSSGNNLFDGNIANMSSGFVAGGAMFITYGNFVAVGNTTFTSNRASLLGGALVVSHAKIQFVGTSEFVSNRAQYGGGVSVHSSSITFNGTVHFDSNHATVVGGGMHALLSELFFMGQYANFTLNKATSNGGALFLDESSRLFFKLPLVVNITENHAKRGGGIFIESSMSFAECINSDTVEKCIFQSSGFDYQGCNTLNTANLCFFQFIETESLDVTELSQSFQMIFLNNNASEAGSVVFGGKLDTCRVMGSNDGEAAALQSQSCMMNIKRDYGLSGKEVFRVLSTIESKTGNISKISSEPFHICFCDSSEQSADIVNCSYVHRTIDVRPGQEFSVYIAAVGDMNGTISTVIRAQFSSDSGGNALIGSGGSIQQSGTLCTEHKYRVFSPDASKTLILYADGPCRDIGNAPANISIHFLPCPDGFVLLGSQCMCEEKIFELTQSQQSCNVDSGTIKRDSTSTFWIAGDYNESSGDYKGLISNPVCPLDYCTHETVEINLRFPDVQCSSGHSGILCGGCKENLSITLGPYHCRKCSNEYITLIIPFAFAGIALVVLLFVLRLTVAGGTLSGLIFYANIIAVNHKIFFRDNVSVLSVFISWINLDLGIESCFYNGMDAYAKVWLQFVFPVYVWMLVGIIVLAGTMSQHVANRLGSNPVAVLATLFLLSYTKVLHTITTAFTITHLEYQSGEYKLVWLYDGNISYFETKRIPLFVASLLVLLLLIIPYTLLLLLGQWLQRYSGKRGLRWMNSLKMKAFLDAYYGPFCAKHRYWTGLLLLLRSIIYFTAISKIVSAVLLVTISLILGLAIISRFGGRIYENPFLEALEASFFLNLGILAAATYHIKTNGGNQEAVTYLSVSIAFVTFIGIVFYHSYLQLREAKLWQTLLLKFKMKQESTNLKTDMESLPVPYPTTAVFALRETLLDHTTS